MLFAEEADRTFAAALQRLTYCNPFVPERIECEREALGPEHVSPDKVWHALNHSDRDAVMARLGARATAVARAGGH